MRLCGVGNAVRHSMFVGLASNRITDARKWVADTESAIRQGRHFETSEAKKHTVSDLIKAF